MKLRTASESVGWLNSVGPLSTSPKFDAPPVQEDVDVGLRVSGDSAGDRRGAVAAPESVSVAPPSAPGGAALRDGLETALRQWDDYAHDESQAAYRGMELAEAARQLLAADRSTDGR
jgi:hypothetical protein